MRGWTWIGGDSRFSPEVEEQMSKVLEALAARWSRLERSIERRSFVEDGQVDEEMMEALEEADERDSKEQGAIEATMLELGARMMRPYEHWNEDERYMEWAENRYDDRDYY